MVSGVEIIRSSKVLIDQHRILEAELVAAGKADHVLDEGDIDGHLTWLRILWNIKLLKLTWPANDDRRPTLRH